jgi:hypothetical protein
MRAGYACTRALLRKTHRDQLLASLPVFQTGKSSLADHHVTSPSNSAPPSSNNNPHHCSAKQSNRLRNESALSLLCRPHILRRTRPGPFTLRTHKLKENLRRLRWQRECHNGLINLFKSKLQGAMLRNELILYSTLASCPY